MNKKQLELIKKLKKKSENNKKLTLTDLKSFIRLFKDNLYLEIKAEFDWMIDWINYYEKSKIIKINPQKINFNEKDSVNSYWIKKFSLWYKNHLSLKYNKKKFWIEISNCLWIYYIFITK